MTTTRPPPAAADLIETFPIAFADGRTYEGTLYRTERRSGRRVLVREVPGGPVLFDSDDCFDSGNVRAKLETWLSGQ